MKSIKRQMRLKLQRYAVKLSRNWKPKLITLGLAVVVWLIVSSVNSENAEADIDDTRIVIPE
ncbi:MAG: hypothetical protein IKV92_10000 [Akkermansia sp.]|nr:hypothetical protein [Akkermansia sp.]MBR5876139.1 hypothetical protein [Akkermansia sp.]